MGSEVKEQSSGGGGGSGGGGKEIHILMEEGGGGGIVDMSAPYYLDKFTLFETPSNFYMVGRDGRRERYRVLKISRSDPSELVIFEDPTVYSYPQCKLLLEDINEVNKLTGGRKFVTNCYGIVGFIKFLGPYYILVITERKQIGMICGHPIYAISEYKMIPIPHSSVSSCIYNFEREKRYKKLLWLVDMRKDFFFSYTYPIMHSLQKNLNPKHSVQSSDGTIFAWNDRITKQIRNLLKNTLWTVALVHGFFKQVELPNGGKNLLLTLIARRSCLFAGTRYQRRGVNKEGQAANDVEIEQIVSQESPGGKPYKITSLVQNRGSIPIRWSQEPSLWNPKPDILISEGGDNYEATRLHFENIHRRYGDPIFLLSLIKTCEAMHRESPLHEEFQKAVACINTQLAENYQLNLLSLDLDSEFRTKDADVMALLKDVAASVLKQTGIFSCQVSLPVNFKASQDFSGLWVDPLCAYAQDSKGSNSNNSSMNQAGVLRTNCLDSLDRTNFAQYVYGLVALEQQLNELESTGSAQRNLDATLVDDLMNIYQALGDALAQQYGGSAAHSKMFSKTRGQCNATTRIQELIKSMQRHLSNSFLDFDKQQAIDIFLGEFQPGVDETPESQISADMKSKSRSRLQRSKSDSGIFCKRSLSLGEKSKALSTKSDVSDSRHYAFLSSRRLLTDLERHWFGSCDKDIDEADWLSWTETSDDSGHEESDDGWVVVDSPASSSWG